MKNVLIKDFDKEQYKLIVWWYRWNKATFEGDAVKQQKLKEEREKNKLGDKSILSRIEDAQSRNPNYFANLQDKINRAELIINRYHATYGVEIDELKA